MSPSRSVLVPGLENERNATSGKAQRREQTDDASAQISVEKVRYGNHSYPDASHNEAADDESQSQRSVTSSRSPVIHETDRTEQLGRRTSACLASSAPRHLASQSRGALVLAALAYAERGWRVFPLRPHDKRPAFPDHAEARCTGRDARCRRAGRHVLWEERATTDPARITAAWTAAPYGIGIATGPSGLLVIDLDQPKVGKPGAAGGPPAEWDEPGVGDGADVFALLCQRADQPFPWGTHTVRTGSGGIHLYFTVPTGEGLTQFRCTAGHLGWLIDTRAHGGYVVAPPSTVAGRTYEIETVDEAAPLPAWLAEALTPRPLPAQAPTPVRLRAGGNRGGAYVGAAITGAVEAVHASAAGQHNRALYGAAVQLGQLVAGGALDAETVRAELLPAGMAVGQSEAQARSTITSGLRAGAGRPRTLPAKVGNTNSTGAAA